MLPWLEPWRQVLACTRADTLVLPTARAAAVPGSDPQSGPGLHGNGVAAMTGSDLSLLMGVLAAACVLAAVPADRTGDRTGRDARDVRLMAGNGAVPGAAALWLQLA